MGFIKNALSRRIEFSEVIFIAIIHLVLILYGFILTIEDMINEEYPYSLHEGAYVGCYYFVHFLLILLLLAGSKKKMPILYLPWLAVFLAIFTTATFYWLESVTRGSIAYVIPSITNIIVLGLGWLSWYTVAKNYTYCKKQYTSADISTKGKNYL